MLSQQKSVKRLSVQFDKPFERREVAGFWKQVLPSPWVVLLAIITAAVGFLYTHELDLTRHSMPTAAGTSADLVFGGHSTIVSSLVFTPNGKTLLSGSWDSTVREWDIAARKPLGVTAKTDSIIFNVALSADGKTFTTAGQNPALCLWKKDSGRKTVLIGKSDAVRSAAFSPDGMTLASPIREIDIRLWDVASGQPLGEMTGHTGVITAIAFSKDGKVLATGSHDKTLRLWDVAEKKEIARFELQDRVSSLAFSPDDQMLAAGTSERSGIRIWNWRERRQLANYQGHTGGTTALAYSPDGRTLASASEDRSIRLWNTATGKSVATLYAQESWIKSLVFSPDGGFLASGSDDGSIRLWNTARWIVTG